jgi:hypothetical protein
MTFYLQLVLPSTLAQTPYSNLNFTTFVEREEASMATLYSFKRYCTHPAMLTLCIPCGWCQVVVRY